ncbi:MAG TPA: hypothetical protein VKB80_04770 [Kofleriaceae bacterium]|nr:hypothetical protein [Kofleriaceae bacterium]
MAPRRAGPFAARGPVARLLIASAACGAVIACGDVETTTSIDDAGNRGPDAGGGATADAAPVDPDAAGDVCATWDPGLPFEPCDIPVGVRGGPLVLLQAGTYTYDTETDELTSPGGTAVAHSSMTLETGGEVRLISTQRLVIAGGTTWRVTGTRPLVVIAWNAMEIAGTLNASSKAGHGPGAGPPECANAQIGGPGSSTMNGQGGGGGGGFGGRGGEGGSGGGEVNQGNGGSFVGGVSPLRGGCAGGDASGRSGTARGGQGGGALALGARLEIQLTGIINAGGAGGGGGEGGGGAGGGSGGMLWLDAPSIALSATAVVAASGGGGGAGSTAFSEGDDGEGARPDGARAHGAPGDGAAGDGGDGSDLVPDGRIATPSSSAGGGGGGGGAGVIRVDGDLDAPSGATIVPFPVD